MRPLPRKPAHIPASTEFEPFVKRVVMRWEKVEDRSCYPWNLPAMRAFEELEIDRPVTFFVGENGSGKSTLLEAIAEAYGMNSEGGSRNHNFQTTSHQSLVAPCLRLVRPPRRSTTEFFLRAESMYNVLSNWEEMGVTEPMRGLHLRSHGEGFLEVVSKRFGPSGFYVLDEPESALSPQNQLTLLCHMAKLIKTGSQFIIATHSPILMAFPKARLIHFGREGLSQISYRETEHYMITRRVLEDPEGYVEGLLGGV